MHREPRRACWMAAFALPWAFPALTLLTLWAGSAAQAGEPSDPDAAFRQILLKLGDEFKGRMYTAVEFPKSPEATAAREQARQYADDLQEIDAAGLPPHVRALRHRAIAYIEVWLAICQAALDGGPGGPKVGSQSLAHARSALRELGLARPHLDEALARTSPHYTRQRASWLIEHHVRCHVQYLECLANAIVWKRTRDEAVRDRVKSGWALIDKGYRSIHEPRDPVLREALGIKRDNDNGPPRYLLDTLLVSGLSLFVVILVIAVRIPHPSPFQLWVFRVLLALAGAAFAAPIPGYLEFKHASGVMAGGALAVFAILYLVNPPRLIRGASKASPAAPADPPRDDAAEPPPPGNG